MGNVVWAKLLQEPGNIGVKQIREYLLDALSIKFAEYLPALPPANQFENFSFLLR